MMVLFWLSSTKLTSPEIISLDVVVSLIGFSLFATHTTFFCLYVSIPYTYVPIVWWVWWMPNNLRPLIPGWLHAYQEKVVTWVKKKRKEVGDMSFPAIVLLQQLKITEGRRWNRHKSPIRSWSCAKRIHVEDTTVFHLINNSRVKAVLCLWSGTVGRQLTIPIHLERLKHAVRQ